MGLKREERRRITLDRSPELDEVKVAEDLAGLKTDDQ